VSVLRPSEVARPRPDDRNVAKTMARCRPVWMTKPIVSHIRWLNGERVVAQMRGSDLRIVAVCKALSEEVRELESVPLLAVRFVVQLRMPARVDTKRSDVRVPAAARASIHLVASGIWARVLP
jgi:hypothetical protein